MDRNCKKLLLKEFGSVKQLKEASLEQLEKVLPKEVAANLFNVLKKRHVKLILSYIKLRGELISEYHSYSKRKRGFYSFNK